MKRYKCNHCGRVYLECDMIHTKCSENMIGPYLVTECLKCLRNKEVGILEELHYYRAFVNPRNGYCYPVFFESTKILTPEEIRDAAKEQCFFLCVEDADDLEIGDEISYEEYAGRPSPEEYIQTEYGDEDEEDDW